MPATGEKVNYGLVIEADYPECEYARVENGKGYNYDDITWAEGNDPAEKPAKAVLDARWDEIKRDYFPWDMVIKKRDELLKESDIYVLPDYPHADEDTKQAWIDYRAELRNLPDNVTIDVDVDGGLNVNYPTKPE
jgi:hypothetical protein